MGSKLFRGGAHHAQGGAVGGETPGGDAYQAGAGAVRLAPEVQADLAPGHGETWQRAAGRAPW